MQFRFPVQSFLWMFFVAASLVQAQEKEQPKYTNALSKESSPYLLMHAHNPVNWHAWNEATLAKAKREDKPIFLSIGYSSCHWCHVMERESFMDDEIAKFLNKHFVCVKVDREERPDVDEIYMHALMEIRRGGGGWPLSMFMTAEAKPFFGGTYWPARDGDRGARMGFLSLIKKVEELYRVKRKQIEKDGQMIADRTRKALAGRKAEKGLPLQAGWTASAITWLADNYDPKYGGFRFDLTNPNVPKFPQPSNLFLLNQQLQDAKQIDDADEKSKRLASIAKSMVVTTCERMAMGGMYDHLGGGFHRYSVDRYWAIPHFEKMLYDNGQLATVYAELFELSKREDFRRTLEGILEFVKRELTAPNGGFYSSLDAESEGEEGKFYRWSKAELKSKLTATEFDLFAKIYRINEDPNFEKNYYAPQLKITLAKHAKAMKISEADLVTKLDPIRKKLFDVRANRIRPLLDHKILTAWNGMMIRGFADAGRILDQPQYNQQAAKAADFALQQLVDKQGRVKRTYTDGQARLNGYLIDYACLIDGLLALHRSTKEPRWLSEAHRIQKKQIELFWDEVNGGFFYTSSDHEVLIARSKQMNDGAMPSGNSVSATNLLYLSQHLDDKEYQSRYREKAKQTVLSASPILTGRPFALPRMLTILPQLMSK